MSVFHLPRFKTVFFLAIVLMVVALMPSVAFAAQLDDGAAMSACGESAPSDDDATSATESTSNDLVGVQGGLSGDASSGPDADASDAVEADGADMSAAAEGGSLLDEGVDYAVSVALASNSSLVVDIAGASTGEGAAAQTYQSNGTAAQKFRIERVAGLAYSVVCNVKSGLALTVSGSSANNAPVVQAAYSGATGQLWKVVQNADGTIIFQSALSPAGGALYVLTAVSDKGSGKLSIRTEGESSTQLWKLVEPQHELVDGVYEINSQVAQSRSLDVAGASNASGANISSYASNNTDAQRFAVTYDERVGYYRIVNAKSNKALDVAGGSGANGANVWQYDQNGTFAQYWSIEKQASGYRIVSAVTGAALDVAGASAANGANVQMYAWNGTKAQLWGFTKKADVNGSSSSRVVADGVYVIRSAVDASKVLDVAGGSTENTANIQAYTANGTAAQAFYVAWDSAAGFYRIVNVKSGKALDVSGASRADGANVWQYDQNGSQAQYWKIERAGSDAAHPFRIVSVCSGKALDVSGASKADGANVQQYAANGTAAQLWGFEESLTVYATLPVGGGSSQTIIASLAQGIQHLFLPSYSDEQNVDITLFAPVELESYYCATSGQGVFAKRSAGDALDLKPFATSTSGVYDVYVKRAPECTATLLRVMRSANIRTVYLQSADPVNGGRAYIESTNDHSTKSTGSMALVAADGSVSYDGALTQIKGRGNSSWTESDKKSYQIKLSTKTSLIDGTKANSAKTWLLISNGMDESLMRNNIALKSAYAAGLASTPECAYCDLYYDGEYRGNYLLCEKVQIGKGRIEIDEIENASMDSVDLEQHAVAQATNKYGMVFQYVQEVKEPATSTGGFLLELDNEYYSVERSWFATSAGIFVIKSPENASENQVRYISELMQEAINAISNREADASAYFDLESLAKVFCTYEMGKDLDYMRATSTFFYKAADSDRFIAGPIWDFDASFGVIDSVVTRHDGVDYASPIGYSSENWNFFMNNLGFKEVLSKVSDAVLSQFDQWASTAKDAIGDSAKTIEDLRATIGNSAQMNEVAFGALSISGRIMKGSFDAGVDYLKAWLTSRLAWMETAL